MLSGANDTILRVTRLASLVGVADLRTSLALPKSAKLIPRSECSPRWKGIHGLDNDISPIP